MVSFLVLTIKKDSSGRFDIVMVSPLMVLHWTILSVPLEAIPNCSPDINPHTSPLPVVGHGTSSFPSSLISSSECLPSRPMAAPRWPSSCLIGVMHPSWHTEGLAGTCTPSTRQLGGGGGGSPAIRDKQLRVYFKPAISHYSHIIIKIYLI